MFEIFRLQNEETGIIKQTIWRTVGFGATQSYIIITNVRYQQDARLVLLDVSIIQCFNVSSWENVARMVLDFC